MSLLEKLVGFLSRAFNRDPIQELAFRVASTDGSLTWTVANGTFSTVVVGGTGPSLTLDLGTMTVAGLAATLAEQIGYTVPYTTTDPALANLSALVLVDGSGNQNVTNGDHVFAFTNEIWAFMGGYAAELTTARVAIQAMPPEMSTTTADGVWIDYLGSFYRVPRVSGEVDSAYALRIVAETLLPKGNNVAMEMAIEHATGQPVTVLDVQNVGPAIPDFAGEAMFDGTYEYNAAATAVYNLFDVQVGFDLINGSSPAAFTAQVILLLNKLRDAGNFLRTFSLSGSSLTDTAPRPIDNPATLIVTTTPHFDGVHLMDGTVTFSGSLATAETLA